MHDVILHLDGDAFFASIEQALDPALRGKPVMTGAERGIVCAFSYEAKARGITRGMQTWKAREVCPELIVRNSDYRTYQIFGRRAAAIIRRYIPFVEEYGVDEAFARIPNTTLEEGARLARIIQDTLARELGVTYSIGVARTKVLAKVGSKWQKPRGITVISDEKREEMLQQLSIGKLWGIGRRMTPWLYERGITTAYDLATRDQTWVARTLDKPYLCIWAELRGVSALGFGEHARESRGSIQKTETFKPASSDRAVVWGELVKNIWRACETLRGEHILARSFSIHLKTQQFTYSRASATVSHGTAYPEEILELAEPLFEKLFKKGVVYRATGITLWETMPLIPAQKKLFGEATPVTDELTKLYKRVDAINANERRIALGFLPKKKAPVLRIPLLRGGAR